MNMRSRTVRSYKVWMGMEASLMLAGSGTFYGLKPGVGEFRHATNFEIRTPTL